VEYSTNSCALAHSLTDPAAVEQAVMNVAERSFFAFAEPADPMQTPAIDGHQSTLTAAVSFSGPSSGSMRVTMPEALTRELAQMFAGDPDMELTPADVIDMAGEFANMVTGAWLTAVDSKSTYNLSAPVVTAVSTTPPVALVMQINSQPVWLAWSAE
jgi:CheY-specific phosphatase CheX